MGKIRRSKTDLILEVLGEIRTIEKTIGEISKTLDTNWDSVKDAILFLKKIGQVKEIVKDSDKKYLAICYGEDNNHIPTYFKLPISTKIEKFAGYVYNKINEYYKEIEKGLPTTTLLQKISVDIFENQIAKKIAPVPTVWYLYGKISIFGVRQGDQLDKYSDKKLDSNIELQKLIKKTVQEFRKNKNTRDARYKQYSKEKNSQYLSILQLEKLGTTFIDIKKNYDKIIKNVDNVIAEIPDKEETQRIIKLAMQFKSLLQEAAYKNKDVQELREPIYSAIRRIWEAVAIINFCDSLLDQGFNKQVLTEHIMPDLWQKELNAQFAFDELRAEIIS